MWGKGNPSALLVGMWIGAPTVESSIEIPQQIKMHLPFDQEIPLLGIYLKEALTLIQKNIAVFFVCSMFIAELFIIAKIQKQPKCPSVNEWLKQPWNIYTMKYYLAVKKKKILPFGTIWMDM